MKQVYYIDHDEFLNGQELSYCGLGYRSKWRYGEIPTLPPIIYSDFDKVVDETYRFLCIYSDSTILTHKVYLRGTIAWNETIKVFKDDFKELKIIFKIKELKDYTMEDLMKQLSAEDFIEYCKDNGMTICSMR